jgi:hypothetical protein
MRPGGWHCRIGTGGGGRLGFVVTNMWLNAGYGEPLRRRYGEAAWVEQVARVAGAAFDFVVDADQGRPDASGYPYPRCRSDDARRVGVWEFVGHCGGGRG